MDFFSRIGRKILAWQKIQPSLGLHSKRQTNDEIKIYNRTHKNIKAHKAKYIQMSGQREGGGGGVLSESIS